MRSKEDAHDYRYFPDPDLLPLEITPHWIAEVKAGLPELPGAMKARFEADYGLSAYDASVLTTQRETADFFGQALAIAGAENAKLVANWMQGELSARLKREERDIADSPLSAQQLAGLVKRIADGTLSSKLAKEVFDALWNGESSDADALIESRGLKQVSDASAIGPIIDEVLAANPKSVEEFRAGKEKAFNALVGQVMKATRGKANPQQVNDLLRQKLAG
jgi:aspartyl-tRNA(Asn)/glutamyl-tRNA(Gln) amidotransferase subunit B